MLSIYLQEFSFLSDFLECVPNVSANGHFIDSRDNVNINNTNNNHNISHNNNNDNYSKVVVRTIVILTLTKIKGDVMSSVE